MAFIYSTRFALGAAAASGPTLLYTVPTGKVAVIRSTRVICAVATGSFELVLNSVAAYFVGAGMTALTNAADEGRHVLNEGDTIELTVLSGTVAYVISGYLLETP